MDKLNLGALGERLKTGGAQMGRMVSGKMKEILQAQTPESKMVDEATSDSFEEPNWGMNLKICGLLNSEEFSGTEIVRAIKKKIGGKNMVSQRLSLDLLEACAMNCEKVFSEVASEKVLDEMVKMIENPQTDHNSRQRALQLIRAWGESEDLAYLPVFRQTYMSLKTRGTPPPVQDYGTSAPVFSSFESDVDLRPLPPPEAYPIPDMDLHNIDHAALAYHGGSYSVEEKKEFLVITRNSVDLLSTMLKEIDPKLVKDDLTLSILDKCKQSQPVLQRIIESTSDDDGILFEALNLHDELQQVISKYEEMEAAVPPEVHPPKTAETTGNISLGQVETVDEAEKSNSPKGESSSEAGGGNKSA